MTPLRTACLAAVAWSSAAASPAAAQLTISVGRPPLALPNYHYFGTVAGYRPLPAMVRPPVIGVVNPPGPLFRPVPPVLSLRPNIYPAAYVGLLTPGYETILANNIAYYYYPTLPLGATFVQLGGASYYQAGGVWFQPYPTAGGIAYLVVPPPV
jgi:hypothetical protein